MDQSNLLIILTVFVAISAVSLGIQAVSLLMTYFIAREMQKKVMGVWPEIEQIVASAKRTTHSMEKHTEKIAASSVEILDISKRQLDKVDDLLSDASTRAKVQMERAEMVLDDTMTRVQSTVSMVQRSVIRPIREMQGLISGVRTAVQYFGRANRSTVDHATSDEEMFI